MRISSLCQKVGTKFKSTRHFLPTSFRRFFNKYFNPNFRFSKYNSSYPSDTHQIWESEEFLFHEKSRFDGLIYNTEYFEPSLLTLILTTLSLNSELTVLDWGGGTGFIWAQHYKTILSRNNINWNVYDNDSLRQIGLMYSQKFEIPVSFVDNYESMEYDLLYINCSLQYALDYKSILTKLLCSRPRYIMFQSLYSTVLPTFTVNQSLYNISVPCTFVKLNEFIQFVECIGYKLAYQKPNDKASNLLKDCFSFPRSINIHQASSLASDLFFVIS